MPRRWIALILCLPLVLVGCSKEAPKSPEPVQVATAPTRPAAEWEAEGKRLVGEAKWAEAGLAYAEAAKQNPTADLWNEASYAYLMAGQYPESITAGESAIKLNTTHAYALYNTGMAYLESGKPCDAIFYFNRSAANQGERWELSLALWRAYAMADLPERAGLQLAAAKKLGAPAEEIAHLHAKVDRYLAPPTADVLTQKGQRLMRVADVSFYRLERGGLCNYQKEPNTYVLERGVVVPLLPGVPLSPRMDSFVLSNGQHAYWAEEVRAGAPVGTEWVHYLFVLEGGEQRFFKFRSPLHTGAQVPVDADFVPDWGIPKVKGDRFETGEGDGTNRFAYKVTWRIDPVQRVVTQVDLYQEWEIKIDTITATGVTGRHLLGSGWEDVTERFTFGPTVRFTRSGKPSGLETLKVGEDIHLRVKDGKVFELLK